MLFVSLLNKNAKLKVLLKWKKKLVFQLLPKNIKKMDLGEQIRLRKGPQLNKLNYKRCLQVLYSDHQRKGSSESSGNCPVSRDSRTAPEAGGPWLA